MQYDIKKIQEQIKTNGYFVLKNERTIELANGARQEYRDSFNKLPLRKGGFSYSELQKTSIRKKNISSANGVGESYPQVLQTVYYPTVVGLPNLKQIFDLEIEIKNQAVNMPADFGNDPKRDQWWNASRVHHYPCGGGFMVQHRDTHFPNIMGQPRYIQVLFLMSEKGKDFHTGGGFIYDLSDRYIDIEEEFGFGTMFFFDGRIAHGVKDVDPLDDFSLDSTKGRMAALTTLYQYRE